MTERWLLRLARWARRPPTPRQAGLFLAVLLICLGLAALEWSGIVPADWGQPTGRALPKPQALP